MPWKPVKPAAPADLTRAAAEVPAIPSSPRPAGGTVHASLGTEAPAGGLRKVGRVGNLLAGMRIRKKLVFLHTVFSLLLAGVLAVALYPALNEVVRQAEAHEAAMVLSMVMRDRERAIDGLTDDEAARQAATDATRRVQAALGANVSLREGSPDAVGLDQVEVARVRAHPSPSPVRLEDKSTAVAVFDPRTGDFIASRVVLTGARDAVVNLYILMTAALLAVYALVALTLELFVLPQHVYRPIRTLLDADAALQEGRVEEELIPASRMPADELGEIMRSRNESVSSLRRHEGDLAAALSTIERVASDLRSKNHLLETAQRNLADADRLASLGIMSAGIAHELNTPLSVLKGMVEKLNDSLAARNGSSAKPPPPIGIEEAALMLRVVGRLEKLSDSLLDFARVRPGKSTSTPLRPLIDEAWTLVRLDRDARLVHFQSLVPNELAAWCDPDRIMQVLVNLLRNAVDVMDSVSISSPAIRVEGNPLERDGRRWVSIRITDNGRGIAPEALERLFQPFVSTRLDAKGTGLGLAVADGIVREHGGVILARNLGQPGAGAGAVFEIVLPETAGADAPIPTPPPDSGAAAK